MDREPVQTAGRRGLVNIREAADYLGLSTNTLYQWCSKRRLPHIKVGRLVKFDLQELDSWIKKNRVKTTEI